MNRLICFICVLVLQQSTTQACIDGAEPIAPPLVKVVLDADFRPEAKFYIAESLRRPPIDWNMLQKDSLIEESQVPSDKLLTANILAAWNDLWENNPLQEGVLDTVAQHWKALEIDLACAQALAADSAALRVDAFDMSQLPTVNTGEEVTAELARQEGEFPLDPYGYDEYNGYFAPDVYDWFVFVTDDLSVVYVHENSDVGPAVGSVADTFDTPPIDLTASAAIAEELAVRAAVSNTIQVIVQYSVTPLTSGEIEWYLVPQQTVAQLRTVALPVWDRYVRHNELFHSRRVADLSKLLRF